MFNVKVSKGVNYYSDFNHARAIRDMVMDEYPACRIVEYDLGYAIQYYPSGPYYPEVPNPEDRYNPANW